MAYLVGNQCISSYELANDYVLSQVQPVLTSDGILAMQKVGKDWYFQGQKVQLNFPVCSQVQNFKDGFVLGTPLITLCVMLFAYKTIKYLLHSGGQDG